MQLACPRDGTPLNVGVAGGSRVWVCARCHGRATTLAVVRKLTAEAFASALWVKSERSPASGPACPSCRRKMRTVYGDPEVDVCRVCHLAWFDTAELESAPAPPPPVGPSAVQDVARARAEMIAAERRQAREVEQRQGEGPEDLPRWILVLLGLPTEMRDDAPAARPVATWSLAGALVLAFVATSFRLDDVVAAWGFVTLDPWRRFGSTVVTSFFLHAGWAHLLSNLYFLVVFGDDAEREIGPLRFLLLVGAAAVAGNLLYPALALFDDLPHVGASAGVSGVLAYYAVRFPNRRLHWILSFRMFLRSGRPLLVPAWLFFVFWGAMQFIGAAGELEGFGGVAHIAHLGGAAVGIAAALWRRWSPERD